MIERAQPVARVEAGRPEQGLLPGDGLQAAAGAAAAQLAPRPDDDVAELAGVAAGPGVQRRVDDQPGPDAHLAGHEHARLVLRPRAEAELPEPGDFVRAPTRFESSEKPVDLRSIIFAWQRKDDPITDYIAATRKLNEELPGAAGGAVQNLVFAERLELIRKRDQALS